MLIRCDLCGKYRKEHGNVWERIHKHHRVTGLKNKEIPEGQMTDKGVVQKIFNLCYTCHLNEVHSKSPNRKEKFLKRWGKSLEDFLYEGRKIDVTDES